MAGSLVTYTVCSCKDECACRGRKEAKLRRGGRDDLEDDVDEVVFVLESERHTAGASDRDRQ